MFWKRGVEDVLLVVEDSRATLGCRPVSKHFRMRVVRSVSTEGSVVMVGGS